MKEKLWKRINENKNKSMNWEQENQQKQYVNLRTGF